jgi:hypothetical protein
MRTSKSVYATKVHVKSIDWRLEWKVAPDFYFNARIDVTRALGTVGFSACAHRIDVARGQHAISERRRAVENMLASDIDAAGC